MQPAFTPAPVPDEVRVSVVPGSRMESLLAQRAEAIAARETADARVKMIKAAVENELTTAYPGVKRFRISAGPGWPALVQRWVRSRRMDPKRLKEDLPAVYDEYAPLDGGHWELRPDTGKNG